MATKISMDDLFSVFQNLPKNSAIIDIRTQEEYSEGHVPGAQNIPVDQIAQHTADLKKYDQIYLYCRSGGRVSVATQILESQGLSNVSSVLSGGFPNWAARGYDTAFED
jgi:rhodanese-related sulfurtransferase